MEGGPGARPRWVCSAGFLRTKPFTSSVSVTEIPLLPQDDSVTPPSQTTPSSTQTFSP